MSSYVRKPVQRRPEERRVSPSKPVGVVNLLNPDASVTPNTVIATAVVDTPTATAIRTPELVMAAHRAP